MFIINGKAFIITFCHKSIVIELNNKLDIILVAFHKFLNLIFQENLYTFMRSLEKYFK